MTLPLNVRGRESHVVIWPKKKTLGINPTNLRRCRLTFSFLGALVIVTFSSRLWIRTTRPVYTVTSTILLCQLFIQSFSQMHGFVTAHGVGTSRI